MEVSIEQAVTILDELWESRQLDRLQVTAQEVAQQRPATAQAWRYLGIVGILRGGGMLHSSCAVRLF